jgi:hypothetical protein
MQTSSREGSTTGSRRVNHALQRLFLYALLVLPLGLAVSGCGDDGVFIFITNFGTIDSDAVCSPSGGQFPLRQQQGLVVLVVFNSDSAIILSNGSHGTCHDLTAGSRASVRGVDEHGQIRATDVHILGP